jgi:death-on-curing protein
VAIVFLTLDEVLALHADQIERYGGRPGIRDVGLLQSALATPSHTFASTFLHGSLAEMAAAYLFHLIKNHPFIDGNTRVGLIAALAFLGMNGREVAAGPDELVELVMGTAAGRIGKAEFAVFLERHTRPRRRR